MAAAAACIHRMQQCATPAHSVISLSATPESTASSIEYGMRQKDRENTYGVDDGGSASAKNLDEMKKCGAAK